MCLVHEFKKIYISSYNFSLQEIPEKNILKQYIDVYMYNVSLILFGQQSTQWV